MRQVFITGATGFMGRRLTAELLRRGHRVRALARAGSENRLSPGCESVAGDATRAESYSEPVRTCDTFVQLVGVAHPSPAKAEQFRSVDREAARAAIRAATSAAIQHFVYVSVAHPAPIMKDYIEVRAECEAMIRAAGLNATILRPWYVLGPGRRWPLILVPIYWVLERLPRTRESARRLGLVTADQMIRALVNAVENPCRGIRVLEVPEIRLPQNEA